MNGVGPNGVASHGASSRGATSHGATSTGATSPAHASPPVLAPARADFFQWLRRLECAHPGLPRCGSAAHRRDEPVRIGQSPAMAFPTSTIERAAFTEGGGPMRLQVHFFGLLGPGGPLPLAYTEFARDLQRAGGQEAALPAFLDLFVHRMACLLYRAWALARPAVCRDRRSDDPFTRWLASLAGHGLPELRERDRFDDEARWAAAGVLVRQVRSAEGLVALLEGFLRLPVQLHPWRCGWVDLPVHQRTRLRVAGDGPTLGQGLPLGGRLMTAEDRFEIEVGPVGLADFRRLLPGEALQGALHDAVLAYVGWAMACRLRLRLRAAEVPLLRLVQGNRLGWTSWLGTRRDPGDATDVCLDLLW